MKVLRKYNKFRGLTPINENLDRAKKFLKQRHLLRKAAEELGYIKGELKAQLDHDEKKSVTFHDFTDEQVKELKGKVRGLKLSDEEVRSLERDPEFLKLREILSENIGYLYNFTYMYFVEMIPIEEVQRLYQKLLEYKDLLNQLPKKFDAQFIDTKITNNAEILEDGLDHLENYRKIKKVIDRLPNFLKREYKNAAETIKKNFDQVAVAFSELGKKEGSSDDTEHERLWETFFGGIRRYRNLNDFIRAAQNYLKASANSDIVSFYQKVNECNEKLGMAGANVVFDEGGILILEVMSYQANRMLNSHTRHCIASSSSYWDSYVGSHNNKQYYIYNFNIPQYENQSVIGITIEPGQRVRTAHDKADRHVSESSFKSILRNNQRSYNIGVDLWSLFQPMTREEIQRRERAKIAEREIVKKGLSIEQIVQYVKEDGANINKNNGVALSNAVEENDLEKVKTILQLGGSPNLKKGADAPISKAQNLEMIKLLVSHGSDMTGDVFNNIIHDLDGLEYCLKAGLDPNFNNHLPFRKVCKGSWDTKENIGKGYLEAFKLLLKYGAKLTDDRGRNMIIKWASEHGRFEILEYLRTEGYAEKFADKDWKDAIAWISHSRKILDDVKAEMKRYLEAQLKEG